MVIKENAQNIHLDHAGIAGDMLLGPYSLPSCLIGTLYYDYLRKVLPELLQEVYF
jgi:hypothetical protein